MQSQSLMEWALAIMANLLRPDQVGPVARLVIPGVARGDSFTALV